MTRTVKLVETQSIALHYLSIYLGLSLSILFNTSTSAQASHLGKNKADFFFFFLGILRRLVHFTWSQVFNMIPYFCHYIAKLETNCRRE